MTTEEFNSYEWHDAIIKKIEIDRTNAGYIDIIEISTCWYNGTMQKLIFKDVYNAILDLNFAVIGDETIYTANIIPDTDTDLLRVKHKWKNLYPEIDRIMGYYIQTSSTGSKLKIFSMSFEII